MTGHRFSGWIVPLLAAFVVLFSAPAAAAAAAGWEPLELWGGAVQLAGARGDSSILYASSWAAGLYRSLDGGASWQLASRGPNQFRVEILGVDPHDPRRLYVIASDLESPYRGFFRSEDGGKRWRRSDGGIAGFVLGVAFDPKTPGRIYAAASRGLFRSEDRGASWERIAFPGRSVSQVAVAPGNPRIVLAAVQTGSAGATVRSTDGGATFAEVFDRALAQYVFDPAHPGRLYGVDVSSGLYRSDDLGATWTSLPRRPASFSSLAITPAGTLLAGAFERGVARSLDGGLTWRTIPGTADAMPVDSITSFVVRKDGVVLAGGAKGVWRSLSDGRGWEASSTGIRAQWIVSLEVGADAALWASTGSGVFLSADEGESFQPRLTGLGPAGFLESLAIHPEQPEVAYAFGCCAGELPSYGLLKTEDAGRTWDLLPYTGVLRETRVVAVDPEDPDFVYAGGSFQPHSSPCTAVRSTDGGATWHCMLPLATLDFTDLVIDPRDPRILYGLFGRVLHRSPDRGKTWEKVAPQERAISLLTLDPTQPGRFFARPWVGSGILRSQNGGRSWKPLTAGLPANSFVHDLLLDPARPGRVWIAVEVFAGGQVAQSTSRIFRSDDAGSHWTEVSAGLAAGDVVLHLAADPRAADVLYAGTAGQGLYRLVVEE